MIAYLDASALVKNYFEEPGSNAVRSLPRQTPFAVYDQRLLEAARQEGLEVFDSEGSGQPGGE